jgi:DNA repair protein RadC
MGEVERYEAMRIKDKSNADRPREKLKTKGAEALSDLELLQALIGSGNSQTDVVAIARRLYKVIKGSVADLDYEALVRISGLGPAKISEILAALELGKRFYATKDRPIIDSPEKAAEQLADIRDKQREYFVCLTLDGANRLVGRHTISIGTLTSSLVHPREVFAPAIADRAASVVVAHNHPSGSLESSPADAKVTERLRSAGELLGVSLVDHIIVTKTDYRSII